MLALGIDTTPTYSEEDILAAEVECINAQINYERAWFDAISVARNVYNFNEIISSLKKHSSAECMEFATDLIGFTPSMEADEEGKEKAKGAFRKAIDAIRKWWIAFTKFVGRCYYATRDKIKSIIKLIPGLKDKEEGTVKTICSFDTLEKNEKALDKLIGEVNANSTSADRVKLYKNFLLVDTKLDMTDTGFRTGSVSAITLSSAEAWLKKANEVQLKVMKVMDDPPDWSSLVDTISAEEHKAIREFQKCITIFFRMLQKDISTVSSTIMSKQKEAYNRNYVKSKTVID